MREDAAAFARKALGEWGFDGLKIDGQHLNGAPPCYNPAHHHAAPEDAAEGVPGYFKAIWDAAQATKPGALIELCPCGTAYSFFNLPYLNMVVASDPQSSWQVRLKGKTLKALLGDRTRLLRRPRRDERGRHRLRLDLRRRRRDRHQLRLAGRPGARRTQKLLADARARAALGEVDEALRGEAPRQGEYLGGLYDIGFDRPEAHVVRKGDALYYAFFAKSFDGHSSSAAWQARVPGHRLRERPRSRRGPGTARGSSGAVQPIAAD